MYRRWRSRRHDFKCLNGEITFEGSYHFAVVRIESLVDQRELFTAETTLQIQQMAKHPRLVLSSHNHYQLMASAISFLTFCIVFVCLFLGLYWRKTISTFPFTKSPVNSSDFILWRLRLVVKTQRLRSKSKWQQLHFSKCFLLRQQNIFAQAQNDSKSFDTFIKEKKKSEELLSAFR